MSTVPAEAMSPDHRTAEARTRFETVHYDRDPGAGKRASIGLLALANDYTIEPELARFLTLDGVAVYASRIDFPEDTTLETLAAMEHQLRHTADLINRGVPTHVIAFGCTSGTMAIGPERVAEQIHAVRPASKVTDPITAGLAGLKALGCQRIAVLTPYIDEINEMVVNFIEARGFEIGAAASFKVLESLDLCRVTPESVEKAAMHIGQTDVDAVFISCTGLRVSSFIDRLEQRLGKPVVSSNQSIAWHALRLAGCDDRVDGYGQLLRTPLLI